MPPGIQTRVSGAKLRGLNRWASRWYSKEVEKIIYLFCNPYTEITAGLKNGPAVMYPHHCRFLLTTRFSWQMTDMLQHGII